MREQLDGTNFVPEIKRTEGKGGEERLSEVVQAQVRQGKASEQQAKGMATLPQSCPLEKTKP